MEGVDPIVSALLRAPRFGGQAFPCLAAGADFL